MSKRQVQVYTNNTDPILQLLEQKVQESNLSASEIVELSQAISDYKDREVKRILELQQGKLANWKQLGVLIISLPLLGIGALTFLHINQLLGTSLMAYSAGLLGISLTKLGNG
jgi:hypothetical protein